MNTKYYKHLDHGSPTSLWQRATVVFVGRLPGHTWTNSSKW